MELTKKAHLKGSESRDNFRHWHKNALPKQYYGLDFDFVLVSFKTMKVIAILDYKSERESIQPTPAEILAYNHMKSIGIPVFVVQSDIDFKLFSVWQFMGGIVKFNDSHAELKPIFTTKPVDVYRQWEDSLRT